MALKEELEAIEEGQLRFCAQLGLKQNNDKWQSELRSTILALQTRRFSTIPYQTHRAVTRTQLWCCRPDGLQGRPMKAVWFDALVFDTRFGGQNCLSVVQALQAEFGNLMAVRQNLCVQIGVCWLQRLIELAGKKLVIFKFDF